MPKGTIKRIMEQGFGFIKTEEEGKDLFFHHNDLEGVGFSSLKEGQEVEFEMGQDSRGRSKAVKVRLAGTQVGDDSDDDSGDDSGGEGGDEGSDDSD